MSYRVFKRLLGETDLERKCRFLLGAGILLLMTLSFWGYARQTEGLAYDQMATSGRLLVPPILAREHRQLSAALSAHNSVQLPAAGRGAHKRVRIRQSRKTPDVGH